MSATPNSDALNARAEAVIAGGVVSPARKTEQGLAFARGQGAYIWDVDGNQYIDYHAAFAPHLLGHNDPDVNAAVWRAMQDGWSLIGSGTTPWEVRLAELICESVPSCERIQVLNSGSEATSAAIRIARAWTRRTDIIVMLGGYNGYHNDVARTVMPSLEATGPRVSPGEYEFLPLSADIPESTRRSVHVVNYNDADSVEYVMRRYPIAGVILEPVLQNIGIMPPLPGYLAALRRLCDEHGALLIFDEVKTGFRSALGGYQAVAGVTPDLSVFGKAVANGYPLAVLGGRADVMNLVVDPDPARRVYIAGTYNAHPHATAAAIATLEKLRQSEGAIYDELEATTTRLTTGLEQIFAERGITATVSRNASAFVAYFADHQPLDWHDLNASHDWEFDRRYRRALIAKGIYHFPVAVKQGSVSAAHTSQDVDRTLELTREVLREIM